MLQAALVNLFIFDGRPADRHRKFGVRPHTTVIIFVTGLLFFGALRFPSASWLGRFDNAVPRRSTP